MGKVYYLDLESVQKNPYNGLDIVNGKYQSGTQPLVTVLLNTVRPVISGHVE